MFSNFFETSNGKVATKVIATLLVIALTFTNFIFLGKIFLSYALDEMKDEETQVENVKFGVYFGEKQIKSTSGGINSNDPLKLNAYVQVKNSGYLENAVLSIENANFEIMENKEGKIELDNIKAGTEKEEEIEIMPLKPDVYNLELLNKQSIVRLTGIYNDENGNKVEINTAKEIEVKWVANDLSNEDIKITQEVITNKIVSIGGVDKRIIQVQVNTGIIENKAPVKEEKIEISLPVENVIPEDTQVMAYSTKATNGKTGYSLTEENCVFNEEQNVLEINIKNEQDENGNVSWLKNVEDKFIVTYVYNADINPEIIKSNLAVKLDVYGRTEDILSKEDSIEETNEKDGNLTQIEKQITNSIYKGNMYIGEATDYKTGYDLQVTYHEIAVDGIEIEDNGEIANKEIAKTYFKGTTINKQELINMFGEEGEIKIYNAESLETPLAQISIAELLPEEEIININYETDVSKLVIKTSKPINEGRLKIINTKVIKAEGTEEEIKELANMQTSLFVKTKNQEAVVEEEQIGALTANLEEPKTNAEVNLDKTVLSNEEEINLNLNVGLLNKQEEDKLFKNPKIIIELPQQVNNVEVTNKQLVGEEELNIAAQTVNINEKQVEIALSGEQTKYNSNGSTLTIDLKLDIEKYICNSIENIKVKILNEYLEDEEIAINKQIEIEAKTGFIVKNEIEQGENKVANINEEQTNLILNSEDKESNIKIASSIMNNYKDKLENIKIVGTLDKEKGLSLAKGVDAGENTQVNYSNEEIENSKTFEIELGDLEIGQEQNVSYELKLPEEISLEGLNTSLKVTAMLGDKQVEKELNYTLEKQTKIINSSDKIYAEIQITSGGEIITEDTVVKEGQMLEYTVKVKNISNEILENVSIEATKVGGNFWTLMEDGEYNDGTESYAYGENEELEKENIVVQKLEPNEETIFDYKIIAKKDSTNLISTVGVKQNEIELLQIETNNRIEKGKVLITVKYGFSDSVKMQATDTMQYFITIKNISDEVLQNIKISSILPDVFENNRYFDNDRNRYSIPGNNLEYIIERLNAGETTVIEVYSDCKITADEYNDVNIKAQALVDNEIYTSNVLSKRIEQTHTNIEASLQSKSNIQILKDGEEITYILSVKNIGNRETDLEIKGNELYGLEIQKVIINKLKNGSILETSELEDKKAEYKLGKFEPQEELKMEITAKLNKEDLYPKNQKSINYKLYVSGSMLKESWEGSVICNLEESNEPENPTNKYSISGRVWQDSNEDGIMSEDEAKLSETNVILIDTDGNKLQETKTSKDGFYTFNSLDSGIYMVAFDYDLDKYTVAKYKVATATEETNSNAIQKKIKIGSTEKDVAVTETISISNANIENINLGLVLKPKPNLELNKFVSKATVVTNTGTTTYQYNNTNLAKIEIPAKKISGTVLLIEYELVVKNSGNASGYIEDIIDYIPQGMEFSSELNPTWYETKTNTLLNKALSDTEIKAGETKSVKLVLTKTLKSNSTGTIENIGETNKNLSHASLIVSIETGSPYMYIGIVVASFAVISIGIWLINKKIINVEGE